MNKNLLKKSLIATLVSAALAGCGPDSGYQSEMNSDTQLTIPEETVILSDMDENTGVQTIDLLQDVTEGTDANGDPIPVLTKYDGDITGKLYIGHIQIQALNRYKADGTVLEDEVLLEQTGNRFITPQVKNPINTDTRDYNSPFRLDEATGVLSVDTGMFATSLSTCDLDDKTGEANKTNPTKISKKPDGFLDHPQDITYRVTYSLNNGAYPDAVYPERELLFTINAVEELVETIDVPLDETKPLEIVGATPTELKASAAPVTACELGLSYSIKAGKPEILTLDQATGTITPKEADSTVVVISSVGNPSLTKEIQVNVVSEFTVAIEQTADQAEAQVKEIPSNTQVGLKVTPTPFLGKTLADTGYTYNWTPASLITKSESLGSANQAIIDTSALAADYTATASVDLTAGDVNGDGVVNADDQTLIDNGEVKTATVNLKVIENTIAGAAAGYTFDPSFNDDTFYRFGSGNSSSGWYSYPRNPTLADANPDDDADGALTTIEYLPTAGLNGSGALGFTLTGTPDAAKLLDEGAGEVIGMHFIDWSQGPQIKAYANGKKSFFGERYGTVNVNRTSWNRTFKVAMWVKVIRANGNENADLTVTHSLLPWTAIAGGVEKDKRVMSAEFVGTIPANQNGEWVYVEFVNHNWSDNATNYRDTFTIPKSWKDKNETSDSTAKNISVMPEFLFEGLQEGDQVLLDEYSLMEVDSPWGDTAPETNLDALPTDTNE